MAPIQANKSRKGFLDATIPAEQMVLRPQNR